MRVFSVIGPCAEKSELVARLAAALVESGYSVSTIKRVPDGVDLDTPGSGSWRHRQAGASEVMLASATRFMLMRESPVPDAEPDVDQLIGRLAPVDLVLLEGFRLTLYPKLEIVTPVRDRRPLALDDPTVVAVTAVESPALRTSFIPLSDTPALTRLVLAKAEMVDERMSRFQASQQASTLVA